MKQLAQCSTLNAQRNMVLNRCVLGVVRCAIFIITLSFCSAALYAQEVTGQRWAISEPGQHPSGAVSRAVKGAAPSSTSAFNTASDSFSNQTEGHPPFLVQTPKAIVYPRKAVRKGWEGQTVVAAEVLPDGSVGRTVLAKTSGHEVLDQAAQEAIQSWKFETESEKEAAVPQYVDIPVTFKLEQAD